MSQWKQDVRIRYQGRFVFSIFPRGHVSWCHLKVIQGPHQTLVILTSEEDNPGTFIANGAAVLATQIVNLFGLEPATTLFLERTPPVDTSCRDATMGRTGNTSACASVCRSRRFLAPAKTHMSASRLHGPKSSDYDGPRYTAHHPVWEWVKPVEVMRQMQKL